MQEQLWLLVMAHILKLKTLEQQHELYLPRIGPPGFKVVVEYQAQSLT
jgi:hypothetical protein